MNPTRPLLAVTAFAALAGLAPTPAPIPAPIAPSNYPVSPTSRDGRNDFNFAFGTWRTHYRLLRRRLAGSHDWYYCYGTSVIRPFWNGGGNLEDAEIRCPHRYIGGLTLRLYDERTHQWTLWWGTRQLAVAPPQQVGHFDANGVGRFYAYDSWHGTPVINRFQWTKINGNPHFEQAYSADHGKTWEVNWITDTQRVSPSSQGVWNAAEPASGSNGFAFLLGRWKTHYMRLRHPLANDHEWYACEGTSVVTSFWGGSGDLEDADFRCPTQYIRGVTLRIYMAATHQWLVYWGTQKNGLAQGLPQAGRFNNGGVGEFFAPDTFEGKPIIVRYRWELRNGNPHYEQAFSPDNGKTWETNWTTDYRRIASTAADVRSMCGLRKPTQKMPYDAT